MHDIETARLGMFARSVLCFLWSHLSPGHVFDDVVFFLVKDIGMFLQLLALNI